MYYHPELIANRALRVSILILALLFNCLLIPNLFFCLGLNINWALIGAIIISTYITAYIYRIKITDVLIVLVLAGLSMLISAYFFDISDDGQGYHLDTIIALKEGWNPIYEKYTEPVAAEIYVNHYSKGKEIISSIFYFISDKMEAAKANNFLILFACFGFCREFLNQFFSNKRSLLLTFLIVLSPTVVTQLFTNYVDGFAYNTWLILIISLIFYLKNPNIKSAYILIMVAVIFVSLKFTSIPVIGITGLAVLLYWYFGKQKFPSKILYVILTGALLVITTNINPYLLNLKQGKSIFYPAYGKNQNVLSYHLPQELEEKTNIYKFFVSIFYKTGRPEINYLEGIKYPFTFNFSELKNLAYTTTLGGYGVLFSGIVLLSFLIFLFTIFKLKPSFKKELAFFIIPIFIYASILPASWMARIIPYAYLIPILFISAFLLAKRKNNIINSIYKFTIGLMLVNISLFIMIGLSYNFYYSMENRFIIDNLKKENQEYCVKFNEYISNFKHLQENEIKYKICELNEEDENLLYFKPKSKRFGISIKSDISEQRHGIHKQLHKLYSSFTK